MKKIISFIFFFSITHALIAQNRFSQFYSSPLLFNPAATGRFNKSYRVSGGFRSEKNAASLYNHSFFSVESKIFNSIIPENDCFAIGIVGLNERSLGEGIKNDYLSFSLAYQKGLDIEGEQQIGVGFQTTLGRKRIEPPAYIFEDQLNAWIQSGFTNIDIFQINSVDVSYLDLNVGIVYQGKINSKNFISVSTTLHHANEPNKPFQGGELLLTRQFGAHVAWESILSQNRKIYSAILTSFSKKTLDNFLMGFTYQINIKKNNQLSFGGWFKKSASRGEFFIPTLSLSYSTFTLNISYDINISLKNTTQKGASEISLTHIQAITRSRFLENKFIKY